MKRAWIAIGISLLLGLLLYRLSTVLTPVFVALFLAYLLDPLVTRLERHMSRNAGSLIAVLLLIVSTLGLALLVVPLVFHQARLLAERLPDFAIRLRDVVLPWLEQTLHFRLPDSIDALIEKLGRSSQDMQALAESAKEPLSQVLKGVWGTLQLLITTLVFSVIVPFLSFFFLRGFPRIRQFSRTLVPVPWQARVFTIAHEIGDAVSAWLRGQFGVMLVQAACYSIGLSIIGLDFAVLIGLIAGLLAFIPYAGVAVGLTIALITSLIDFHGWSLIVGVLAVFAAVQTLDGLLITPRLVGSQTGLGPAGVVIALLVCGDLFGFVGVLLAVPIAASAVVVVRHALESYSAVNRSRNDRD